MSQANRAKLFKFTFFLQPPGYLVELCELLVAALVDVSIQPSGFSSSSLFAIGVVVGGVS
jgi:hypothetical protein